MKQRNLLLMAAFLFCFYSSFGTIGCSTVGTAAERTGHTVGHAVKGAGHVAGEAVEDTGEAIDDTAHKAKEEVH